MPHNARVGFYERRVFPWLNDRLNLDPRWRKLRAETLVDARGRVIEIGFGSGANLAHYPPTVESVTGIEPNEGMLDRAVPHLDDIDAPVDILAGTAERLPLDDQSFDTAVSTLTLCSVADPDLALAELRRVLRDDGRLIVLEHGLAGDAGVARWQKRLNAFQMFVACGCHLDRAIAPLVERAGFRFETLRRFYAPRIPRTHGFITIGTAVKA